MTVRWTVRAANDRARSVAAGGCWKTSNYRVPPKVTEPQRDLREENRARNHGADPCGLLFFVFLWSTFTVDCNEALWTKSKK